MERGLVILTPGERVSRHCIAAYDTQQQEAGAAVWQAPAVYTWSAWVNSLWQDAMIQGKEDRVLFSKVQERTLWRKVLATDIRPSPAQIRLCVSATHLLGGYDVNGSYRKAVPAPGNSNERTFATWYWTLEERCREAGCLPAAFAETELARHLRAGDTNLAAEYILYGFGDMSPAQTALLDAVRSAGSRVRLANVAVSQRAIPRLSVFATAADEVKACVTWVRQRLLSHPASRLTIVVPALDDTWLEFERALRAAIAPELSDVTRGEQPLRYEVSGGRALGRLPLVADALRLLRWCAGDLSVEEAGSLLRSSNLALASSPDRGAELDAFVLRKAHVLRGELSLRHAADVLRQHDHSAAQRLDSLATRARPLLQQALSYAECAGHAVELLREAGWAGSRELNSEESQAVERWGDALDQLATLDLFGNKVTFAAAIEDLNALAHDIFFVPEKTGASVQVVAWHEIAGAAGDALWLLHVDENTLASRFSPHPLLPIALQRELAMPGTHVDDDERTLALTLRRLSAGHGETVLSYASANAEGPQRLAPVVRRLAEEWGAEHVSMQVAIEPPREFLVNFEEDSTTLPALHDAVAHGGVDVIAKQSLCPFRAFAEHRLFATAPEKLETGYRARDRGDHVHKVLNAFWTEVRDHATLLEYTRTRTPEGQSRRDALLRTLIGEVYGRSANAWDAAYRDVQRQRLFRLLSAWLDVEAKRSPFTVVAVEKEISSASLGPLHLKFRVDRIDAAIDSDTAATLILDYKTGPAEPRDWNGDRPSQPQLPVYAVASGVENVRAIAFAGVKARDKDRRLKGCGDREDTFGVGTGETTLEEQLATWQTTLVRLATAYAEGDTSVNPKEYPLTCEFCNQRMLCRVEESKPVEVDDPDELFEVVE